MDVLVLDNEEIRDLLPLSVYIDRIEAAYRELGAGRAVVQPRVDVYTERAGDDRYSVFKTMLGSLVSDHMVGLRICSDIISWHKGGLGLRKEKVPAAEGRRWVGLLFFFDTQTGELRAILPDGEVQRRRVAATTAVAVRHLARQGANSAAIYGAGFQAEAAIYALHAVLPDCEFRIWSPTTEHRQNLATRCSGEGIAVTAVTEPRAASVEADVVVTATNALDTVVHWDWIAPGAVIACVKAQELGEEVLRNADRIIIHTRDLEPINYLVGEAKPFRDTDFVDRLFGMNRGKGDVPDLLQSLAEEAPDLADVLGQKVPARSSENERIVFLNPVGTGLQFAAIGRELLAAAEARGVGRRLPGNWFTENLHP